MARSGQRRLARRVATFSAALGSLIGAHAEVADACRCVRPIASVWSPRDGAPAPINSRITAVVRTEKLAYLNVRPLGGTPIATTNREHDGGDLRVVVMQPKQPLAPHTRYEVILTGQPEHPRTLVFGTFATGDAADTTPPRFDAPVAARYHDETVMGGTSCESQEQWIELIATPGTDGREGATLLYGIWSAQAPARPDTMGPPTWVIPYQGNELLLGATRMCASLRPSLPAAPTKLNLEVAALDDAGNRSTTHRLAVTIAAPHSSP